MPGQSSTTPRERMIAALHAELGAALAVGDIEAARIAHEALGRLLGTDAPTAAVSDLAAERRKWTER